MKNELLQKLVMNILEPGIYKTTAQVVEEFRMEYPDHWRILKEEGEALYGTGCSSVQRPSIRISQVLLSMPAEKCLCRRKNKSYYWSIREH